MPEHVITQLCTLLFFWLFFFYLYHKPYTKSILKPNSWVCKVKHLQVSSLPFYGCPCNCNSLSFPSCTVNNRISWGRSVGRKPIIMSSGLCINANAERGKFLSWCFFPPQMIQQYDGPSLPGFFPNNINKHKKQKDLNTGVFLFN